jgi:hypothetical protein
MAPDMQSLKSSFYAQSELNIKYVVGGFLSLPTYPACNGI